MVHKTIIVFKRIPLKLYYKVFKKKLSFLLIFYTQGTFTLQSKSKFKNISWESICLDARWNLISYVCLENSFWREEKKYLSQPSTLHSWSDLELLQSLFRLQSEQAFFKKYSAWTFHIFLHLLLCQRI